MSTAHASSNEKQPRPGKLRQVQCNRPQRSVRLYATKRGAPPRRTPLLTMKRATSRGYKLRVWFTGWGRGQQVFAKNTSEARTTVLSLMGRRAPAIAGSGVASATDTAFGFTGSGLADGMVSAMLTAKRDSDSCVAPISKKGTTKRTQGHQQQCTAQNRTDWTVPRTCTRHRRRAPPHTRIHIVHRDKCKCKKRDGL